MSGNQLPTARFEGAAAPRRAGGRALFSRQRPLFRRRADPRFGEAGWTGLSLNQALRRRRDGGLYGRTPLVLKMLEDDTIPDRQ